MRTPSETTHSPLPAKSMDLKKPPVVETALGCYFSPIDKWNVLHFGVLWTKFRAKYPHVEVPPPVGQQVALPVSVHWAPGDVLIPIRALFTDVQKTQLVQLQTDLFLHNWRKTESADQYEHY